jgi:O-antigen ligase
MENAPFGAFFFGDVMALVAVVLFILSWLVPLHFPPWVSWHSEAMAFCAVFLLGWCGLARVRRSAGPRTVALPLVALPFIGLALVAALQRAGGLMTFWGDVWVIWFYTALCVTCLTLGFAAALPSAQPRATADASAPVTLLAFALLVGALASTVIALSQVFSLWERSGWIVRMSTLRAGGNLAQPNHLATLLVMGVASLVLLYESRKLGGIASGLILMVLGIGLAAAGSRTGMLGVLALMLWWLAKRRHFGSKTPAWVAGVAGGGFALSFWAWPTLLNSMLLSYQTGVNTTSIFLRFEVWQQLLEAVALRPWWGWGIREVAKAHNAVAHNYAVSAPFAYSHNLVLDLVLWTGLPLAGVLVIVIGAWLWRRVRAANQLLPWYGLAAALPVAMHSMLEYPFAYAYFLAPVMFALGAVEASSGVKPLLRMGIKPVAAMLLATTAVLAWSMVEYLEIEEDFRVARFEALRVGSPPPGHQRPKVILYTQLDVLLDDARITPTPNMSTEAMQVVKTSALYYPWSATQYRYAVALALNGDPVEAARQIQVMRRLWGEEHYEGVKRQINELAASKYPELRQLGLP